MLKTQKTLVLHKKISFRFSTNSVEIQLKKNTEFIMVGKHTTTLIHT